LAQVLKFTKIQELIYELPIERVMKKGVIRVSPETSMTELKEVLRVNRISGVPVLDGDQLVGVISIEDLIKALVEGDVQAPVRKRMTTRMITVRENESVVEAVKKFAQYKVGRLLVVNEQGQLKGILTGGSDEPHPQVQGQGKRFQTGWQCLQQNQAGVRPAGRRSRGHPAGCHFDLRSRNEFDYPCR
jgi:CBS domain-containing protein